MNVFWGDTGWYAMERDLIGITEQITAFGFPVRADKAQALLTELLETEEEMTDALQRMLPPVDVAEIIVPKRDNKTKRYVKGEPFTKHKLVPFNPNSGQQFIERMVARHGSWPSTVMTDSGNPSCTAAVLATLDWPEAKALLHLKIATKRIGMLSGDNGYVTKLSADGRLHTVYHTLGAITGRASHQPNVAQVPSVQRGADGSPLLGAAGLWGYEFRDLFVPPEGWVLVGADLIGLEARVLAHYIAEYDGGAYAKLVTGGTDLHEVNRQNTGASTRAQSKRLLYACVPMDTQALTRRGWIGYDDLRVGELVLTYNAESRQKEWQPVLEKVYYPEADVMELRNDQTFAVRCTPNHRWFTTRRTWSDRLVEAADINTEHNIIVNAPMAPDQGEPLSPWQHGPNYGPDTCRTLQKVEHPRQPVWCIRTANQSWVMRQGSTITITGNTIFGCGNRKAGTIVAPDEDDDVALSMIGKMAKDSLIAGIVGFGELFDWLNGRNDDTLPGLDGRILHPRKKHTRLNTLIQAAGAILAKRWLILTDQALQAAGLRWARDYATVGWIHDETLHACRPELAEQVADITKRCAVAAGEYYHLRCPLGAEAKIGASWAEVH